MTIFVVTQRWYDIIYSFEDEDDKRITRDKASEVGWSRVDPTEYEICRRRFSLTCRLTWYRRATLNDNMVLRCCPSSKYTCHIVCHGASCYYVPMTMVVLLTRNTSWSWAWIFWCFTTPTLTHRVHVELLLSILVFSLRLLHCLLRPFLYSKMIRHHMPCHHPPNPPPPTTAAVS